MHRIGIVGCGMIAASHVRILKRLRPDAAIILCDADRAKAEALASRWQLSEVHTSLETMLSTSRLSAVHIVTPPKTHAPMAELALRSGCHVLVEKPITEYSADYQRLLAVSRETGKMLCGDYSTLGMPVVMEALADIRSGKFGRLVAAHCDFAGSEKGGAIQYSNPHHWAYELRGGILQNMIDHPLSLVLSVMEPIEDISLFVHSRSILPHDCPDLLHLSLRSQDQVGSLTLSLGHGANERRAHFMFEGGTVILDLGRQLYNAKTGRGPQNFVKKALSGITEGWSFAGGTVGNFIKAARGKLARDPGIVNVMASFYDAIDGKGSPLVGDDLVDPLTTLLDKVWDQIGYAPVRELSEVTR